MSDAILAALLHQRHIDVVPNLCYGCEQEAARLIAAGVAAPPSDPAAPLREAAQAAIVLMERLAFSMHYGRTLADHQSVSPGYLISMCVDDPCPQTVAAVDALRAALATPAPEETT